MIAEISCGVYSCSPRRTLASWPMRRLIDLTVSSGASNHWLRAACPTSRRPYVIPDASGEPHLPSVVGQADARPVLSRGEKGGPPTLPDRGTGALTSAR